jgi:hypothetical protein
MAAITKTVVVKFSCTACKQEFTKATLDKNNGVCGRCSKSDASQHLVLPTELLKINNLSISEHKANNALTLTARLDQWYKNNAHKGVKCDASRDLIRVLVSSKLQELEGIKNVNIINFEKMLSYLHNILSE